MQAEITLRQAAQHALKVMDDHMYRADTHEFYEAKEALRAALAEPQTTHWEGCEAVHPECKALSEPEQEPVAWIDDSGHPRHLSYVQGVREKQLYGPLRPLYTAPTPRKPLTDDQIALIVGECAASAHRHDDFSFARAIEKAHGIGEQK